MRALATGFAFVFIITNIGPQAEVSITACVDSGANLSCVRFLGVVARVGVGMVCDRNRCARALAEATLRRGVPEAVRLDLARVSPPAANGICERLWFASDEVVDSVLRFVASTDVATLELGGGAAEIHPRFEELVILTRALRRRVLHTMNGALAARPALEYLPRWLAAQTVEVAVALPWSMDDADGSLLSLLRGLRAAGYGGDGCPLPLDALTVAPASARPSLPQERSALADWYAALMQAAPGISFRRLGLLSCTERAHAPTDVSPARALQRLIQIAPYHGTSGREVWRVTAAGRLDTRAGAAPPVAGSWTLAVPREPAAAAALALPVCCPKDAREVDAAIVPRATP